MAEQTEKSGAAAVEVVQPDPVQGKVAYEQFKARFEKLAKGEIERTKTDIKVAAIFASGVGVLANTNEFLPMLKKLAAAGAFELSHATELGPIALATWYAATLAGDALTAQSNARVTEATQKGARATRERMIKCLDYNVGDDDPKMAAFLKEIRIGHGYQDTATDLSQLAVQYRKPEVLALIKEDRKNFRPDDADTADAFANKILGELGVSGAPLTTAQQQALEMVYRAWTILAPIYKDVVDTLNWIDRADHSRDIPSLVTAGRAKPPPRAKNTAKKGSGTSKEPATAEVDPS